MNLKRQLTILSVSVSALAIGVSAPALASPPSGSTGGFNSTTVDLTGFTKTITIDPGQYVVGGSTVTGSGNVYADVRGGTSATANSSYIGAYVERGTVSISGNVAVNLDLSAATTNAVAANVDVQAYAHSVLTPFTYASASAGVDTGVYLYGAAPGTASVGIVNNGTITVAATAVATGGEAGAWAKGHINRGISETASGANEIISLTNSGNISIVANATANASLGSAVDNYTAYYNAENRGIVATAHAYASVYEGIYQYAGGTAPSASITNSGTIGITANAHANASNMQAHEAVAAYDTVWSYADAGANAYAVVDYGIVQEANGGAASVSLTNQLGGQITVGASATAISNHAVAGALADGTYGAAYWYANARVDAGAYASANQYYGIDQDAWGGSGVSVGLTNAGSINLGAHARASASHQTADATGLAYWNAYAHASAGASAHANVDYGIYQRASGDVYVADVAPPSVSLTNSGNIDITSVAEAIAHNSYADANAIANGTGGYGYSEFAAQAGAFANANISYGAYQSAYSDTTSLGAQVSLANNTGGVIAVMALGSADSHGAHADAWGNAYRYAYGTAIAGAGATVNIGDGIYQDVYAYSGVGGVGTASLTNSGGIDIAAIGFANASFAFATAHAAAGSTAHASAWSGARVHANLNGGIYQYVDASTGSANLTNNTDSTILIGAGGIAGAHFAAATALASSNWHGRASANALASVSAVVGTGIYQEVYVDNGSASLVNSGSITIAAGGIATSGPTYAKAGVSVSGNDSYGTAYANSGAVSYADLRNGIYQYADASTGSVSLTNNAGGNIAIYAQANASASGAGAQANATGHGSTYDHVHATADAGAKARAVIGNGIYQDGYVTGGIVNLTNSGTIGITAVANALALNASANATAVSTGYNSGSTARAFAGASAVAEIDTGIGQYIDATGSSGSIGLVNASTGVINIHALANATATSPFAEASANSAHAFAGAVASANIHYGISQNAYTYGSGSSADAGVSLANTGTISIVAEANAKLFGAARAQIGYLNNGNAQVAAIADARVGYGVEQYAYSTSGGASVSLQNNTGAVIDVAALANATGIYASASAHVEASSSGETGGGIYQKAEGWASANASLINDGVITVESLANAKGGDAGAYAFADVYAGINQQAYSGSGDAIVSLSNDAHGVINVTAVANAAAAGYLGNATATGNVDYGIYQYASASGHGTAELFNAGTIGVHAAATALSASLVGLQAQASAYASVTDGIYQEAHGYRANVSLTNTGQIDIGAKAVATGQTANAYANVGGGVVQFASATTAADVSFTNSGHVAVHATANANGKYTGVADATAVGVHQTVFGNPVLATFANTNTGIFAVQANATANGTLSSSANADATGLRVDGDPVLIAITNDGHFNVAANATGDQAFARALGIGAYAVVSGHATGTVSCAYQSPPTCGWSAKDTLGGRLTNTGKLIVSAVANEGPVGPATPMVGAQATGIYLQSSLNDVTLTNSGRIDVSAQTNGTPAVANGIVVTNFSSNVLTPSTSDVFTLNNQGGAIIARESITGGVSWTRGTAIDAANAPNAVDINLQATDGSNGYIYGNILLPGVINDVSSTVTVSNGETKFDGVINPNAAATTGTGDLIIANGGTLYLVNQPYTTVSYNGTPTVNNWYDGPAGANVANFTVANGGTLALELPTSRGGGNWYGYPVITANTATLGATSTLQLRPASWNGLYANSYTFNGIIVANSLTGTFHTVTTDTGTPLLDFVATYPGNQVDLTMTRVGFGAVSGLTTNQSSVGNGIESSYSPTLTGPYANLLANLFTQNMAEYQQSLDELSGQQYAGYLQSLGDFAGRYNNLISSAIDCTSCDRMGRTHIWGQLNYGQNTQRGDLNAGGYKANQTFLAMGADYLVNRRTLLGLSVAYVQDDLNFDRFGGQIKSNGYQIAGYFAYNPGTYYAKGIVNYSSLDGHSSRNIDIANMQLLTQNGVHDAVAPTQSGSIGGKLTADPKAEVLSLYGEAGYRFGLSSFSLTPYVSLEYTDAKLKAFNETGLLGANLDVAQSSQDRAAGQLGVKIGGQWGSVIPVLNGGWRHQFGSRTSAVSAEFDGAPGSSFSVLSAAEKPDSAFVDASLTAVLGKNVVGRLGYQGRFNGDSTTHSGTATIVVLFGGAVK